jgi:hypothetical protein
LTSLEKQCSRTGSMSDSDRYVAADVNSIIIKSHKEDRCPNPEACGKCVGHHRVEQCTSDITKCARCQGNHAVTLSMTAIARNGTKLGK